MERGEQSLTAFSIPAILKTTFLGILVTK